MGTTDPCALIRRGHAKLWPPTGLHTHPLSWPVRSVAPCSPRGPPPPFRGQGGAPSPSPDSRVQNSGQERTPISQDSWRLLNTANYFLQITPSDGNLGRTLQVQGRLLSATSRRPGAFEGRVLICGGRCSGNCGRCWDRPAPPLLLLVP